MTEIFNVGNIPVPDFSESNYHPGVEALLVLMGNKGFKFYQSAFERRLAGPEGIIDKDDLVVLKVNAQWKHRGMTNVDVVRGLIQRILDHPDGFEGEVVIFENGQGRGSLNCDVSDMGYSSDEVAANAEDPSHTWLWLVDEIYKDEPVSAILFDKYRTIKVDEGDHESQGYRLLNPHPERQKWELTYPVFNTIGGKRVDLRRGIWTGDSYDDGRLKLINIPTMKSHRYGLTGALKLYFGVISLPSRSRDYLRLHSVRASSSIPWYWTEYHAYLGLTCAEMMAHVRAPNLNIIDSIWASINSVNGKPDTHPQRANQLTASTDPVAIDYWAAKHIMFPLSRNPEHNPDEPLVFRVGVLLPALEELNRCGGCNGKPVTIDEQEMQVHTLKL